jgi:hypothetical protein
LVPLLEQLGTFTLTTSATSTWQVTFTWACPPCPSWRPCLRPGNRWSAPWSPYSASEATSWCFQGVPWCAEALHGASPSTSPGVRSGIALVLKK